MKFQLRRFIAAVPWADWVPVLAALLFVVVILCAADHVKPKKRRCPTCNQIMREATK